MDDEKSVRGRKGAKEREGKAERERKKVGYGKRRREDGKVLIR